MQRRRVGGERRSDLVARQRTPDQVGTGQRVEREEHDVRGRRLLDLLGERIVDRVRGDERALRHRGRGCAQRHRHGDEQPVQPVVEPGPAGCLTGQRAGDQGAARQVDVELLRIVGPRHQDAAVSRHQHPGGPEQLPVLGRLVEHVGALGALEQPLAELRHLGAHAAHAQERRGATRQKCLHAAPHARERAPDRLVRRAVRLHCRQTQRHAEHRRNRQGRGHEDLRAQADPRRPSSARVPHSWGSPRRTCSCAAPSGSRARPAPRRLPRRPAP